LSSLIKLVNRFLISSGESATAISSTSSSRALPLPLNFDFVLGVRSASPFAVALGVGSPSDKTSLTAFLRDPRTDRCFASGTSADDTELDLDDATFLGFGPGRRLPDVVWSGFMAFQHSVASTIKDSFLVIGRYPKLSHDF
jgi:hypothetical protein